VQNVATPRNSSNRVRPMHEKVEFMSTSVKLCDKPDKSGIDPFPAIEAVIPSEALSKASQRPNGSRKGVRKAATN
jgi:hypothetical protein